MSSPQPSNTNHAAALQSILGSLGVLTVAQLVDLFNTYSATAGFAGLLHTAVPEIVGQHAQAAATVTAQWYDELAPDLPFQATPVVNLPPERIKKSIDWALHAPTAPTAPTPEALASTAPTSDDVLSRLSGSTKRMVYDAARDTVTTNASAEGVRWARYALPDACAFCRVLATRSGDALYRSEHSAQFVVGRNGKARGTQKLGERYHDHCVPGGTLVSGPRTESAYRRLYEGEAVVIHTASGQKLTITPNHPVLTDQGWIPAGLLNHGDNVIRSLRSDAGTTAVPHEHQQPALIENVWSALAVNGLAGMPGSTEDFHGDGTDSEVQVVWADSSLDVRRESALLQVADQVSLTGALRATVGAGFPVLSQSAALLPASGRAPDSFMRGRGQAGTLLGTCAAHTDLHGGAAVAWFNAKLKQSASNHDAGGVEALGNLLLGKFLIDVQPLDFGGVKSDTGGARFDPAAFEFTTNGRHAYASLGLGLLQRLAGQVELDSIVHLERINFRDHVYNLQTEQGWYSADQLIVSNCRCVPFAIRVGDFEPPDYTQIWQKQYEDARAAVGGNLKAILAHMRANTDAA